MKPLNDKAIKSFNSLVGLAIAIHKAREEGGLEILVECGYLNPEHIEIVEDAVIAFTEG